MSGKQANQQARRMAFKEAKKHKSKIVQETVKLTIGRLCSQSLWKRFKIAWCILRKKSNKIIVRYMVG
jgi:hypothetical protein